MPEVLKVYITGVVTLSAIALVAATLCFPRIRASRIDLPAALAGRAHRRPTNCRSSLGVAFWTLLTLLASALPVRAPAGYAPGRRHRADRCGDVPGARRSAVGRRDRDHRDARAPGRIPGTARSPITLGSFLPAIVGGVVQVVIARRSRPSANGLRRRLLAAMVARRIVFFGLNVGNRVGSARLAHRPIIRRQCSGDSRETAFNSLALGPLGWLMAIVYSIQWWATLLFALPLYTTRTRRRSAWSRCATCSRRRSGRWRRPSTSAIRTRRGTASTSRRSRSTSGG